jgi:hypothetical protein
VGFQATEDFLSQDTTQVRKQLCESFEISYKPKPQAKKLTSALSNKESWIRKGSKTVKGSMQNALRNESSFTNKERKSWEAQQ